MGASHPHIRSGGAPEREINLGRKEENVQVLLSLLTSGRQCGSLCTRDTSGRRSWGRHRGVRGGEGRRRRGSLCSQERHVLCERLSGDCGLPCAPELRRRRGGGVLSAGYARGHCSHRALGTGQPRRPRWRHGFSREGNRGASTLGDGLGHPTHGHAAPLEVARLSFASFLST